MKKIRKIAIVLRMSGAAGRDILSGIFLYTHANPHWHTRLFQMPSEFTPESFLALQTDGFDGIIASEPGPDKTARMLAASKMPVSFIGDPGPLLGKRKSSITYIRNDDEHIGTLGARYLFSQGNHRSYGFIPTTSEQHWARLREVGFTKELKKHGITPRIFRSPGKFGTKEDLSALKKWLISLPKPAAVMACWDTRATQSIQMCAEARIDVPQQISILGVDNDELLDEACTPPLSSILPDHTKLGFVAARELNKILNGQRAPANIAFRAKPKCLVERESVVATAPAAHLVTRATEYIRKNAAKGITANDVAAFLGISRRLADLRFNQFCGETINETITLNKLEAVKKMLATTNRAINHVSVSCGYKNLSYLKTLFKRRFGMTMRDWRSLNHD